MDLHRALEALVTKLGTNVLVVSKRKEFAFLEDRRRFDDDFVLVGEVSGYRIYAPSAALRRRRKARP